MDVVPLVPLHELCRGRPDGSPGFVPEIVEGCVRKGTQWGRCTALG